MDFSPYSNDICQFKIPQTTFSEQTVKYNIRLYFCLYGIWFFVITTFFISYLNNWIDFLYITVHWLDKVACDYIVCVVWV